MILSSPASSGVSPTSLTPGALHFGRLSFSLSSGAHSRFLRRGRRVEVAATSITFLGFLLTSWLHFFGVKETTSFLKSDSLLTACFSLINRA